MKMKKRLLSITLKLLILYTLIGCSSSTLKVESQPEGADVYVFVNGQTSRKIGQTPLTLNESSINGGTESFQLSILKEGYLTEHILVPPSSFVRTVVAQVVLKEAANHSNSSNNQKQINNEAIQKISSSIASIIFAMKNKEYDTAEKSLESLISEYKNVSIFHELLGNVHYLRKDLAKAVVSYRKAFELNPSNNDTQRMIQKIENIRGDLRLPSGINSNQNGGGR